MRETEVRREIEIMEMGRDWDDVEMGDRDHK
jgi:hypothetical protein